jgi:hypothetical protein
MLIQGQGVLAAIRGQYLVAERADHGPDELSDLGLVVDHENRLSIVRRHRNPILAMGAGNGNWG